MHVKRSPLISMAVFAMIALFLPFTRPAGAESPDLTLAAPPELAETGLPKHLFPRFRFKSRIRLALAKPGETADMALAPEPPGVPVFTERATGRTWYLRLPPEGAPVRDKAEAFLAWLQSKPGRAAIAAFPPGSEPLFAPAKAVAAVEKAPEFKGDPLRGHEIARRHCMRCHVVDSESPYAGIGSTPSFAAMRSFPDWQDTFAAFWAANPHRAVVTVEDMSEEKDPERPLHVAPVLLTQKDLDDLMAYVATIKPKDLGKPIEFR